MATRPFIPAPGVAQIEMRYLLQGQPVENVYHFHGSGAWDATNLDALANACAGWEVSSGSPNRHTGCELISIHARDISTSSGAEVDETYSVFGTHTNNALPNNATFCVTLQTGLAGRSLRGRTYWVGLPSGYLDTNTNQMVAAQANAIKAALDGMISGISVNGSVLSVVSFRSANAWRTTALVTPGIRWHWADLFVDSQRRRLAGHNRHH